MRISHYLTLKVWAKLMNFKINVGSNELCDSSVSYLLEQGGSMHKIGKVDFE